MQPASESLIAELELAVKESPESRIKTLRRVTDLFLNDADRLNDDQIKVFDDVLCLLIRRIEAKSLVELSKRLAPIDNAPIEVIRRLARDEEIVVAGPVLTESKRLTANDLVEIAATKGQAHLLAISGRAQLDEAVTDVLLDRGDDKVILRVATNSGARFSETGYGILVKESEADDRLAEVVGQRLDIPVRFLRELLQRATEAVRFKILSVAPPEAQEEIRRVIAEIAKAVGNVLGERDFTNAEHLVQSLEKSGRLNESVLLEFVNQHRYEEMTVALARLCSAPLKVISELMMGPRNDALLVPCRAAGLTWQTTDAILRHRHPHQTISDQVIEIARIDYARLTIATAQRTLRFMQVRAGGK
jgi:uncharacterized protein (DUF2336 family)